MTRDLQTLLTAAAPAPSEPIDVDAVLDRGARLGRRRTAGLAAAALLAIGGAAGIVTELVTAPDTPIIDQDAGPVEVRPLDLVPGTYADGAVVIGEPGEVTSLDVTASGRIDGVAFARIDEAPGAFAVAADRAVGVLDGAVLRILRDGEELASADLIPFLNDAATDPADAPATVADLLDVQIAFDASGTLWAQSSNAVGAVVGLQRGGDVTVAPGRATPDDRMSLTRLRVSGPVVSVVVEPLFAGLEPTQAEIVSVIGDDPLAGSVQVPGGLEQRDQLGMGIFIGPEQLGYASILGLGRLELVGGNPSGGGSVGFAAASAQVADSVAFLSAQPGIDPSVLFVQREDTVVGALLAEDLTVNAMSMAVSPDGAVHVAVPIAGGGRELRTVLGSDLLPVGRGASVPTAPAGPTAPTPTEPVVTAGPGEFLDLIGSDQVWDGIEAASLQLPAGADTTAPVAVALGPTGEVAYWTGRGIAVTGTGVATRAVEVDEPVELVGSPVFTSDGTAWALGFSAAGVVDESFVLLASADGVSGATDLVGLEQVAAGAGVEGQLDLSLEAVGATIRLRVAGSSATDEQVGLLVPLDGYSIRDTLDLAALDVVGPFTGDGAVPSIDVQDDLLTLSTGNVQRTVRVTPLSRPGPTDLLTTGSATVDGRAAVLVTAVGTGEAARGSSVVVVVDEDGRGAAAHVAGMTVDEMEASAVTVGQDGRTYLVRRAGDRLTITALFGADLEAAKTPGRVL